MIIRVLKSDTYFCLKRYEITQLLSSIVWDGNVWIRAKNLHTLTLLRVGASFSFCRNMIVGLEGVKI